MENERTVKQQNLYAAITYYGLIRDLQIVEDKMCSKEPVSIDKSNGTLKNFWNKNFVNESRRKAMRKLSEKKNTILNRIEDFKSKHESEVLEVLIEDKEKLLVMIEEVFGNDAANIAKALFALQFCLDSEIEYENKEEVSAEISEILFSNRQTMSNLYCNLKENYIQLYKAPFCKAQKVMLKCLGIAALIAVMLPPLVVGGAVTTSLIAPALVEGVLAQVGISVAATVECVAVYSSVILGGAVIGTEIAKQLKIKDAKENLRKASPEDISFLLAVKATLIQYSKENLDKEAMKEELDNCLKQLTDLRADAEYLWIVERLDAERSKKKIDICNNFSARLANIVGL